MTTSQMELSIDGDTRYMNHNFTEAVKSLREGGVVLMLDANDRENEGDLIVAAEKITSESMNFLIKKGSGVVCLAMPKARLDKLGLPLMSSDNTNFFQTAFTVSIEASSGVTTGVSAKDRARTVQVAIADETEGHDLARPGHVFPLASKKLGVFERMGHTEGSVDLMRIAGLRPGAVLCELMNEDGSMTVGEERIRFARSFNIPVVTVEEVLFFRMQTESIFQRLDKEIKSDYGKLSWVSFCFLEHLVIDVFFNADQDFSTDEYIKLSVVDSNNLSKRYLAQVLEQNEDDAFLQAMKGLSKNTLDVVVFCSNQGIIKKTPQEIRLYESAAICRVLQELSIRRIDRNLVTKELARIASDYFAIDLMGGNYA